MILGEWQMVECLAPALGGSGMKEARRPEPVQSKVVGGINRLQV